MLKSAWAVLLTGVALSGLVGFGAFHLFVFLMPESEGGAAGVAFWLTAALVTLALLAFRMAKDNSREIQERTSRGT